VGYAVGCREGRTVGHAVGVDIIEVEPIIGLLSDSKMLVGNEIVM
jgi:hypothetical protein